MVRATRTGHCLTGLVDLDAYKNVVTDEDERGGKIIDAVVVDEEKPTKSHRQSLASVWVRRADMERTRSIDADDLGWRFKSSRVGRGQFRLVLANTYTYLVDYLL